MLLLHTSESFHLQVCEIILPCKFGFGLVCGVCVCLCMMKQRGKNSIGYCILSSAIIPKLYKKVCDCLLIVCP